MAKLLEEPQTLETVVPRPLWDGLEPSEHLTIVSLKKENFRVGHAFLSNCLKFASLVKSHMPRRIRPREVHAQVDGHPAQATSV